MLRANPEAGEAPRGPERTGGQDVAILLATRIGLAAFMLLIQAMLAWMLLPEGRGSYAVCIAFGTLLGLLFAPGSMEGAQYFVAAKQGSVSQGVAAALAICLAGTGLAVVLALPLIHSDIAFFRKAETRSFHLALVLVPLVAFSLAVEHQLAALRRFGRLAVFSLLRISANAVGILLLVWDRGLGVDGAVLAFAAAHGVMIAVCLRDLRRHCGLVLQRPARSSLARILGYGFRYHLARVGEGVGPHIGVLVLGLMATQAEIGLFAVASALMLGFVLIPNAVGNALLPRVAGREQPELVALSARLVCVAVAVALAIFLAVAAPAVRLLFSDAFLPAVPLLWILAPGILAHCVAGILMTHFKGADRPDICSWAVCVGLCVNIAALPALFPALGIEAAACAITAGMVCRFLALAATFKRMAGMTWFRIWLPRRGDAQFLRKAGRSVFRR